MLQTILWRKSLFLEIIKHNLDIHIFVDFDLIQTLIYSRT